MSVARDRRAGRGDIAIVGMSCLFPGSADVDQFWRNILGGIDNITEPPPKGWDLDAYFDPDFENKEKSYCKRGGYLGDLARFDPLLHGIPPVSVGGEPDQWLSLQLAHDALADADALSLPPEIRRKTGMILGKGTYLNGGNAIALQRGLIVEQTIGLLRQLQPELGEDKLEALRQGMKDALPPIGPETVAGLIPNIIVGRVANRLDLMGPAYTVDAACASSLLAVQLAQRHLLDGDCDLMIAGGAQVSLPMPTLNVFSHLGALSKTQTIRPFDKNADGTLLGEGIGMVVLKRAADALRDGDRIYSIVKGIGVASDGKGTHVMAPRQEGEETALRRAYAEAGIDPATIGLIEAHGTATAVGDVVEIQALGEVFGRRTAPLPHVAIGTVKSMTGDMMPASGIAGIIKTSLALHHKVLPPTLNVETPNPELELGTRPFYINAQTRPWIHGSETPRRAGVNSFGFGGVNAHCILEEAPADQRIDHRPTWDTELIAIEASDPTALAHAGRALLTEVEALLDAAAPGAPTGLTNFASELASRLGAVANPVRLAIVAPSFEGLATRLRKALDKLAEGATTIKDISGTYYAEQPLASEGEVVLMFPGEGAQYAGMLSELCLHFPEVRAVFDESDRIFSDRPLLCSDWIFPRPSFDDKTRKANDAKLMEMDVAVEAVLAANRAMHKLLERLGVGWDVVVGHSTGEYSAAEAAGVLMFDDEQRSTVARGLYGCYERSGDLENLPKAVLIAIGADRKTVDDIGREAGGRIMVAMDNCKHQVVLVAEPEAAERARAILDRESLVYEVLPFDRAVHTPDFQAYADSLRPVFDPIEVHAPTRPIVTSTTGDRYPEDLGDIRNLLSDHWTSPVEFTRTIEKLHERGARVFVECGPRGNLSAFIDDILRGERFVTITPDKSRRNGVSQLNHFVGMLLAHDVPVDAEQLFAGRTTEVTDEALARMAPKVNLSTHWPVLRLSTEVRGLASLPACTTPPADPKASSTDATATSSLRSIPSPSVASVPDASVEQLVDSKIEPVGPGSQGASEAVLAAHFTRMSQFLTLESEIMRVHAGKHVPDIADSATNRAQMTTGWTPEVLDDDTTTTRRP